MLCGDLILFSFLREILFSFDSHAILYFKLMLFCCDGQDQAIADMGQGSGEWAH
uniref:Uncharacterized protein n=1 Tax=Arundo donax TaxID=35708 RepID=A0A0A9FDW1_ARUDO